MDKLLHPTLFSDVGVLASLVLRDGRKDKRCKSGGWKRNEKSVYTGVK